MKPLSVGNVVSAGLRIYRDNFKKYFMLAFVGYLWFYGPISIVSITWIGLSTIFGVDFATPGLYVLLIVIGIVALIYGWAKFSLMSGLIARLAYREVIEQPETIKDAKHLTKPNMWKFLIAGILTALIIFGAIIPFSIVFAILSVVAGFISEQNAQLGTIIGVSLVLAAIVLFLFGLLWLVSRLLLIELPLALEENATATSTIGKSWNMTKGSAGRIQLVVLIGTLISIPIFIISVTIGGISQFALAVGVEKAPALAIIGGILYIISSLASGALIVPLWQAIKAVLYYDLKVRREGMGLDLRK